MQVGLCVSPRGHGGRGGALVSRDYGKLVQGLSQMSDDFVATSLATKSNGPMSK